MKRGRPSLQRTHALQGRLLAWFAAHRRDLPWRRRGDAYAVWISEAMLQQTRVETVIPYYEAFLRRFPDIATLAGASEADVVAAWSGLGYYRRARALLAAAKSMVAEHGGEFPHAREDVLALPGVGAYTAGAVLSIAFGRAEPIVDGNVARVFARWFAIEDEIDASPVRRELWALAAQLVSRLAGDGASHSPGDWNQALMELGALVCTPRSPACDECPVASICEAHRAGAEQRLPRRTARREQVAVRLESLVVVRGGRLLIERRPAGGRMAEMWEFPTRELVDASGASSGLWPVDFDTRIRGRLHCGEKLHELGHSITHHKIRVDVRQAEVVRGARIVQDSGSIEWVPPADLWERGLTGMTRKILRCGPVRDLLEGNRATSKSH